MTTRTAGAPSLTDQDWGLIMFFMILFLGSLLLGLGWLIHDLRNRLLAPVVCGLIGVVILWAFSAYTSMSLLQDLQATCIVVALIRTMIGIGMSDRRDGYTYGGSTGGGYRSESTYPIGRTQTNENPVATYQAIHGKNPPPGTIN